MSAERLLAEHWPMIERVTAFVCRRFGLRHEEAEDFASIVKVKLLEEGASILSSFKGECRLSTYLSVVIRRIYLDQRVHERGKWHASAEAVRLGSAAVALERAIYERGMPLTVAVARVHVSHPELAERELAALAERLPQRAPRRSLVPLDAVEETEAANDAADVLALSHERQSIGARTATIVREYLQRLDPTDRLMLQLQFESSMQLSKIARMLGIEQKPLYRRRERLLLDLRGELEKAGIGAAEVDDLVGRSTTELDFGLETAGSRPSRPADALTHIGEITR